jgi:hypothetical protein
MKNIDMIAMGCKPDPTNFKIVKIASLGDYTIVEANYNGCLSFGGNKLMLLDGIFEEKDFSTLDPHFLTEDYAVIARFVPTNFGWYMATKLALDLNDLKEHKRL